MPIDLTISKPLLVLPTISQRAKRLRLFAERIIFPNMSKALIFVLVAIIFVISTESVPVPKGKILDTFLSCIGFGSKPLMPVPGFPDIGKNVWEVFRSGYHYGKNIIKVSVTSKSDKNVSLSTNYSVNCETNQTDGNVEAKVDAKEYGSIKEKWSSDGTITLEYGVEGKPITGLTATTALSHNPSSSVSGLNVGAKFKNDNVNLGCSVANSLDSNFRLTGAAVFGYNDLYFGYQAGYDTGTNSMTMNDVGLAYSYDNLAIHLRGTSIPHECGVSVLYKVNQDCDTAVNGILARRDNRQEWTVGVGTRMRLDEKTILRLKLNKDRQMGTSIQQKISDVVTLTLSFNLDLTNLPKGDHKVGLAVDINAS